ncbi:diacylglycerol kinase/PAP2 family protein [Candidatus Magnetoovum chiemensis]|nr:diacylglycerol kinase/PAP2 family protein [Candidatus Magnetoovum chiemensis]
MSLERFINSANYAIEGILAAAKTQRHVRYHLYAACIVILFSYIAGVTKMEFLIISIISLFVIMAELVNTAIEATIDVLSPQLRKEARIAKDVAAGSVLVTAFGALIIGYIILFPYLVEFFKSGFYIARHRGDEVAILSLIIVTIFVILLKAFSGKGHPLRGGMPSGHTATSFSIWVSVSVISENLVVSILTFTVAFLIARSRIICKAHTVAEVFVGAFVGASITYLLFFIFT